MSEQRPGFTDLVAVMARLRAPGGCPWDRQQTHASLRPYLLEEAYEALEAIDEGDASRLREELGDLLLQVVFHAQMAAEAGNFTIDDVVAGLVEKLVRRHPHVFGDARVSGPEAVLARWEEIKGEERAHAAGAAEAGAPVRAGILDGLPRTLPALMLAQQMQARTSRAGFPWPDLAGAFERVREALAELERTAAAGPPDRLSEALGNFLFAAASLPRYLGLDGELVLRAACERFRAQVTRRGDAGSSGAGASGDLVARWRAPR